MEKVVTKAEMQEIRRHQQRMSEQQGCEVSLDEAEDDWMQNRRQEWMQRRQAEMLALQREEINRYKWIESEKARRDLGRDAVLDWIAKNAANWREWYEREYEGV